MGDCSTKLGRFTASFFDCQKYPSANEPRWRTTPLVEFQSDIVHLRTDLERRGLEADVIGSLSAIEERASMETGVSVVKPVTMAAVPIPSPAPAVTVGSPSGAPPDVPLAVLAPAADAARVSFADTAQPLADQVRSGNTGAIVDGGTIETGSLAAAPVRPAIRVAAKPQPEAAAAPISFGPAIVKPAPKPFAVQLASGDSIDSIRLSWSLLSDRHAEALKNLQPRYISSGTEQAGRTFDLIAGPVKSAVDARKICNTLAARGIDCKVSSFKGDAL